MTKLSKNTRRSPSTRILVPLLVFSTLAALALGSGLALGASTAPAPELVATPAKITAARSATFKFRHRRPHMRFQCKLDRRAFVNCKLRKRYSHLVAGGHTFKVRAIHGTKKSRVATFKWIIDRTPPPTPKITLGPARLPHTTVSRTATFRFQSETGAKFLCSLNSSAAAHFTACANAKSYRRVRLGANIFYVKAKDAAGNVSGTARRLWRVEGGGSGAPFTPPSRPSSTTPNTTPSTTPNTTPGTTLGATSDTGPGQDFTISGNAAGLLYPGGPARPIALTLHNPNDVAVYVTELSVSATANTPKGCSRDDLLIKQVELLDRDHVR